MQIKKTEYVEEQGTVLEPDTYEATLTGFGETEGQWGPRLVWQFQIDHDSETVEAAAFTSYSMADKPRKSNLLKFSEALAGKDPEGLDLEDLIGMPCRVEIDNYTKQNGIEKNKVTDVKKARKGQKAAPVEKPDVEKPGKPGGAKDLNAASDDDFDEQVKNLPF